MSVRKADHVVSKTIIVWGQFIAYINLQTI